MSLLDKRQRLSLRLRLTLLFACAMAAVLATVGGFLYFRTKTNLDAAINSALRSRASALSSLVASTRVVRDKDPYFQVIDARRSTVVDAAPIAGRRPLLARAELRTAARHPLRLQRTERLRLYAVLARARGGRPVVIVVGSLLRQRENALEGLARSLLIGGPLALLLAGAAGYWLTARALRPADRMRAQAETISRADASARLPLPQTHDELRRLGETLNAMLERLERTAEHERRFIADASHDLRTPLAILRGELELALTRDRLGEVKEAIASALEETDRLRMLTDDLLTLSRLDETAADTDQELVDVGKLACSVADEYARRLEATVVSLHLHPGHDLRVRGSEPQLRQALHNLLDNALQHGHGSVELHGHRQNGAVHLHVRDRGPGFPADFLPRALDRFSRADSARAGGGSGLGLAIAAAIAQRHGGSIHVDNHPGGGAEIQLILPAYGPLSATRNPSQQQA